ncbi:hypothetical protein DYB32_006138 [Aphanomyces invadans]|uniref:Autophagy-related protein n=1 Tax=Aphanomyces invadans TaxID=157072 RepID=A0A3R6Y6S8_9STRA|nr:hypothetical protein DYB32_006138 [Aphanomyces invadans]
MCFLINYRSNIFRLRAVVARSGFAAAGRVFENIKGVRWWHWHYVAEKTGALARKLDYPARCGSYPEDDGTGPQRIRSKYPDRIPVICEKADRSEIPDIDKKKYLVPADLTVGQFVYVIRKRIKLSPEKAIFIFINNVLPPTASLMSNIYEEQKDSDGFLYITYSGENTFGGDNLGFLDE